MLAPAATGGLVANTANTGWVVSQTDHLTASDGELGDFFGSSVALDGDFLVVGAERDDLEVGFGNDAGSAYVFERGPGGAWVEVAKLRGSDTAGRDDFGRTVAISGDTVVVGAWLNDHNGMNDSGAAYVFQRDQGGPDAWGELKKLTPTGLAPDDKFGISVSISGSTLVVGSPSDDHSGLLAAGSVFVFERDEGGPNNWGETAQLIANDPGLTDSFGNSVSVSGDQLLVGAISDDLPGAVDAGSAYLFVRDGVGSSWGQVRKFVASDASGGDLFGTAVALYGDVAAVGAIDDDVRAFMEAGSVYVHERNYGGVNAWGQTRLQAASPSVVGQFGYSLAVRGDHLIVGAPKANSPASNDAGVAHVFERDRSMPGSWTEIAELYAQGGDDGDDFGYGVAISGNVIAAGVRLDDLGYDIDDAEGLAFDPGTGTLYGVDVDTDQLLTIDTATGAATVVGPLYDGVSAYFTNVQGLAFDPGSGACGRMPAYVNTGLNLVHVDDVARGHLLAFRKGEIGQRYILGGQNMTLREILTAIAAIAGGAPPRVQLPHNLVLPIAFVVEAWARLSRGAEPFVTVDGVRQAKKLMYFTSERARKQLGYDSRPAEEALFNAIEWFQENGHCPPRSIRSLVDLQRTRKI